jgi:predicted nucleotidyltransferase
MNVGRPYEAVIPSLDGEVLQVLAASSMAMTGRQIALLTGRKSHSGVLDVLNRLTEHGLVKRVELNRANLYSLNRDHVAAPAVIALAGLRLALLDRIRRELEEWEAPPIHVSLFGSAARGDGDVGSDIDLFVVRPAAIADEAPRWRAQLETLAERIERWTGNRAAMHQVSEAELARLRDDELPILAQLRTAGSSR